MLGNESLPLLEPRINIEIVCITYKGRLKYFVSTYIFLTEQCCPFASVKWA